MSVINREQPCTAYAVRKAFLQSSTTSWRASTGAIYPCVRKLEQHGLVSATPQSADKRKTLLLELTAKGCRALREWADIDTESLAEPVADPIRTRCYALTLFAESEQEALIARWRRATESAVAALEAKTARFSKMDDLAELQAMRGSLMQLEARLAWLKSLQVIPPNSKGKNG